MPDLGGLLGGSLGGAFGGGTGAAGTRRTSGTTDTADLDDLLRGLGGDDRR
jgi:hypothetical protein